AAVGDREAQRREAERGDALEELRDPEIGELVIAHERDERLRAVIVAEDAQVLVEIAIPRRRRSASLAAGGEGHADAAGKRQRARGEHVDADRRRRHRPSFAERAEREMRLRARSTSRTRTLILSPTFTTLCGSFTKRSASCETWTRPSWWTPTSTNAPNA